MFDSKQISKIGQKYRLLLIYIFGSKALEKNSIISDIDIAVLLNNEIEQDRRKLMLDLIFDFSQIFRHNEIDLLILNTASLAIQYNVISTGKILYQLNPDIKSSYETRIIKIYLDFVKYEEEYYNFMQKKVLQESH
ncbi:MAG: type VII toxin-antitoxin system MntA family adenylyltransferase antitoxin [Candidatus Helarchaeota archaeon]